PEARDPSWVSSADASVAKTRTTTTTESGNGDGQATIGEFVDYVVTATIPAGTTLARDALLTDALDSTDRQVYDPASASATLDGVALPTEGLTFDAGTSTA